ncbi:hypothetical protein [Hydrogenophaga sp.]|uniref:hypothetical protein n=1 Tax=Hydrogenophaga sp. TaxID=1904254 RepID=UPI00286D74F9|nr:hypothetical protein [Hydrogenophaga sp.]
MTGTRPWTPCPHAGPHLQADSLRAHWSRLHRGDAEPLPDDPRLLDGWLLFHNGDFQAAAEHGLHLGGDGLTLANKAACVHASYVEAHESARLQRWLAAADQARQQQASAPDNPNAWYWQAYALGRYSQGISVTKALAQGLGGQIRQALDRALALAPAHAEAHLAVGSFHAEIIDKVGELIGGMTYGARKDVGLAHYARALALNPDSAITQAEVAQGWLLLEGDAAMDRSTALLERAAAFEPLDAMERLYVDSARMALQG